MYLITTWPQTATAVYVQRNCYFKWNAWFYIVDGGELGGWDSRVWDGDRKTTKHYHTSGRIGKGRRCKATKHHHTSGSLGGGKGGTTKHHHMSGSLGGGSGGTT
jgi:hypothetical protein